MPRKPATKPRTKKPNVASVVHSTVREIDEQAWFGNNAKTMDLVRRYSGDVKVAAGLNASGVASIPLRVFRKTQGSKSAWASKRVDAQERARLQSRNVGKYAQKAAEYAGDVEEITDPDHPLVRLLCEFNGVKDDGYNGIEDTVLALGLAGNGYWLKVWQPGTAYPVEIWPLPPQYVRCIPDRERFIAGFTYGRGVEIETTYDAADVVHFKNPNPLDPYYGLGDLQACLIHADVSFDLALFWKATLDNACQPGLVISGAGVTANNIDQMHEALARRYRGVKKAAINAIFSGDIKVDKWALDKTDFSNLAGSAEVRGMIARAFGMPVEFLEMRPGGMTDGKGVAEYQWQKRGLKPRCRRMENKINSQLVPDFRAGLGDDTLFVAFDDAVEEDRAAKVMEAKDLFASNLYSRNRSLSVLGDDPVDDDDVYSIDLTTRGAITQATAMMPPPDDAEDAEKPEAAATPTAPAGPDVQQTALNGAQVASLQELVRAAAAKEIPLEAVTPMMLISFPATPPELIQTLVTSLTGFEPPKPEPTQAPGTPPSTGAGASPEPGGDGDPSESDGGKKAHSGPGHPSAVAVPPGSLKGYTCEHKAADSPDDPIPKPDPFERAMLEFFNAYQNYTGAAVSAALRMGEAVGVQFTEAPILYGNDEAFRELAERITRESMNPLRTGQVHGARTMIEDGMAGPVEPWGVVPTEAVEMLRQNAEGTARDVLRNYDQGVREAVARELADVIADGAVTPEKLQAAVARAIPGVSRERAAAIAETETVRAFNEGQRRAYDDSPFVVGYRWYTIPDHLRCKLCARLNGTIIGKGDVFMEVGDVLTLEDGAQFVNDYDRMRTPPAHTNCRCWLEPVYKEGL